jgi:hypothetical protein
MIETFGYITKEEKLQTLGTNILENTFVLETTAPFPGYHGENIPVSDKPQYIFLVTRKDYGLEKIIRTAREIKKFFDTPFGARPAELHMFNTTYPSIRLNHLPGYEVIAELQRWFTDMGINFMKKRSFNNMSLIRVTKQFRLEEVEEGIYRDLEDPLMHYLEIQSHLPWKMFEAITFRIKNNVSNNNFDAASGVLFISDLMDVVRIYERAPGTDRLRLLREKYMEETEKLQ